LGFKKEIKMKTLMEQIIKNVDRKLITEEDDETFGKKIDGFEKFIDEKKKKKLDSNISKTIAKIESKIGSGDITDAEKEKMKFLIKDLKELGKLKDTARIKAKLKIIKKDITSAKSAMKKVGIFAAIIIPLNAIFGLFMMGKAVQTGAIVGSEMASYGGEYGF
jgi:hypothetical protein